MYSMSSLAENKNESFYCLNDQEIKKISEGIQNLKFCETDLDRLKKLQESNHNILNTNLTVYKTDDLIISFSVGMFFGMIVYKELENNRITRKWL